MFIQRAHGRSKLPDRQFRDPRPDYIINDIQLSPSQSNEFSTRIVRAPDILKEALGNVGSHSVLSPSFRLVEMSRNSDNRIGINPQLFHDLLAGFHISSETCHLIEYNALGIYHFPSYEGDVQYQTCYLNTVSHVLIWSFDTANKTTRAILIGGGRDKEGYLKRFRGLVDKNRNIACQTTFLPLACAIESLRWVLYHLRDLLVDIRRIEATFGFSTWTLGQPHDLGAIDVSELTSYTQAIASALVNLADEGRRLKIIMFILESIKEMGSDPAKDVDESSEASLLQELKYLTQQSRLAQVQTTYLESRARNQFTVLFNLINQKDATTNIQLAAQAKEDSSSMKTIAVMTMVFLPATFFAALFAVPTLQWTADQIVTERFWVYWAFTIPMTLAVFTIWVGINKWKDLLGWLQLLSQKNAKKLERSEENEGDA